MTDPRVDKRRIEETKGGLLRDSYKWILKHEDFQHWQNDKNSRLLWIKGDPGKGKTMLMCGIINELEHSSQESIAQASPACSLLLSFFFCQNTHNQLNNATAILRGLIYLMLCKQRALISHIQEKYDHAGRQLFEDSNAFWSLSEALSGMLDGLRSLGAPVCYIVIDALDECETDLKHLLNFIAQSASDFPYVKWIVSSRNRLDIEQGLRNSGTMFSLELNAEHVKHAINVYIDHKVSQLVSLKNDKQLQDKARDTLREKAEGTFLWVAPVTEQLQEVDRSEILEVLEEFPPGLVPLYARMIKGVQNLPPKRRERCRLIISTTAVAYRPLHLCELGVLAGLHEDISGDIRNVESLVLMCGSFLTIRKDYVYLIHLSAKDYLMGDGAGDIFECGSAATHHAIFSNSLKVMEKRLARDMYSLCHPGASIDEVTVPDPDPLAPARYACLFWVHHLEEALSSNPPTTTDTLQDKGVVDVFLRTKYLYWLEALSLLRAISEGGIAIEKLYGLLVRAILYYNRTNKLTFH